MLLYIVRRSGDGLRIARKSQTSHILTLLVAELQRQPKLEMALETVVVVVAVVVQKGYAATPAVESLQVACHRRVRHLYISPRIQGLPKTFWKQTRQSAHRLFYAALFSHLSSQRIVP